VNFRLPGSRLTNAPLWTATGAFSYEKPFFNTGLMGLAYLDFRYVSSQTTGSDLEPTKVQPEYTMFNGRLALRPESERWSIELWGRNLTDKEVQQIAFNVPLQGNARGAFLGDPRTYGVTLRFDY
jgi:outer membrane receptor protein involved in Fe transport